MGRKPGSKNKHKEIESNNINRIDTNPKVIDEVKPVTGPNHYISHSSNETLTITWDGKKWCCNGSGQFRTMYGSSELTAMAEYLLNRLIESK
jgi:hypothetical protein